MHYERKGSKWTKRVKWKSEHKGSECKHVAWNTSTWALRKSTWTLNTSTGALQGEWGALEKGQCLYSAV